MYHVIFVSQLADYGANLLREISAPNPEDKWLDRERARKFVQDTMDRLRKRSVALFYR